MAKLIKFTGEIEEIHPKEGKGFTLEELQEIVGGYIELVKFDPIPLIVNEEGRILDLPVNEEATELAGVILVGNVISLNKEEWDATMH